VGYEYGNARVACMRARLLDRSTLARIGESATVAAVIAQLERLEDWAPILRQTAPLGYGPTVLDTAVELHRSARLAVLPGYYDDRAQRLVEALVLPLDAERAVAVLRRRRSLEPAEDIASSIISGALLGARDLAAMARGAGPAAALRPLVDRGVIDAVDATALVAAEVAGRASDALESMLTAAIDRARRARSDGPGSDAAAVRRLLEHERDEREAVIVELQDGGPTVATILERATRLARLDGLAALGRRDPLGIGVVAGYVAAVEAQAVRLRAMIARVRAGWAAEDTAPYLAAMERPAWLASSS